MIRKLNRMIPIGVKITGSQMGFLLVMLVMAIYTFTKSRKADGELSMMSTCTTPLANIIAIIVGGSEYP